MNVATRINIFLRPISNDVHKEQTTRKKPLIGNHEEAKVKIADQRKIVAIRA